MFITPSFKKSLIVEQFQGNYLKEHFIKRFSKQNRSVSAKTFWKYQKKGGPRPLP